jgi:hypothetical protein
MMCAIAHITKQPSLKLKIWPKQLLVSFPVGFVLPRLRYIDTGIEKNAKTQKRKNAKTQKCKNSETQKRKKRKTPKTQAITIPSCLLIC